ncbi:hypothetical protein [Sulfitobacter pontiacus]|uniref:hypothetical protein n=1 Tax=Sulfitobacter pontiacus TaxID=60137 RepID=UPI0030EEF761
MTPVKVEVDGVEFAGFFVVDGDMLKVTGIQGRTKVTQLGEAPPEQVAKIVLGEITCEAIGYEPEGLEIIEIELTF